MKTLILACFSCVLLTGVYFMLNDKSQFTRLLSFTQPESVALTATPVPEQNAMVVSTNLDAATSLAPVETLPTQNDAIPVINAIAVTTEIAAANDLKEAPSNTLVDSNWFDYSVFQINAAAETTTAAQPADPVEAAQAVIAEEENKYVHTPFLEEEEVAAGPALESRRLIMKLNPETADSAVRYSAPKQVVANSIAHHTVATASDKMVVNAAVQTEEKSKVTYAPSHLVASQSEAGRESYSYTLLYDRAEKMKAYAAGKGYDTTYAFMIDMGMKSGKKRFFVMDLNTMTIVKRGMVAHGRGNSSFTFNKNYSNKSGSNCTSLGIYKVGAMYKGSYGTSFKLNGLESTNSNASKRSIILHGLNCIPYEESEFPICQSEGCPSLSPAFLKEISSIINTRHKPMLLWIYDPLAENIEEEMVANY
jgi:hypothetical protein